MIRVFYLARSRTPTLTRKMYVYICRLYMCLCFMSFYLFSLLHYLTLISSSLPLPFLLALPKHFRYYKGNCSVLTLNVRGLRSQLKRRSIFSYLKDQNCQFYFLQEIYSEPNDEKIWRGEWGGDIFFSHGSTHSKGVCILVNPSLSSSSSIENFSKDRDGRIVSINLIFKTANISLCNVYAPNDSQQQQTFLHILNEYLMSNTDTSNLIIGGDWNVTLQSLDKRGGVPWKASTTLVKTSWDSYEN